MKKLLLIALSIPLLASAEISKKPKVIFFDVNETLLDLNSMKASVTKALNGRQDLLSPWFTTMLHYSLVTTSIGEYYDFGQIGVASLQLVAQNNNIEMTEARAKEAIIPSILTLSPHPDVASNLKWLKEHNFKLVSFTNSSLKGVTAQLNNAKIAQYFDENLSIEEIKIYKPNLKSYEWALNKMDVKPEEALMVAAHAWDTAGAQNAGLKTAFLQRPGINLFPIYKKPDLVVKDLNGLVEYLKKFK